MRGVKGAMPDYEESEAHIVRRLGWAIIEQWEELPKAARDRIVEQAVFTHDQYQTVQLKQQIVAFIEKHTSNAHRT